MAASATAVIDGLARQYGDTYELLLDGADTAMRGLWLTAGSADPVAWAAAAGDTIAGFQNAAAQGAAAWVDVQAAAMGAGVIPPAEPIPIDPTPPVLRSPSGRLVRLLAQGMDYAEAIATVAAYVGRLTTTTVRAAEHTGRVARAASLGDALPSWVPAPDGGYRPALGRDRGEYLWVRVPDARACSWCRMVANGRFYTDEGATENWHAFCRCTWRMATADEVASYRAVHPRRPAGSHRAAPRPAAPEPPYSRVLYMDDLGDLGPQGSRALWKSKPIRELPDNVPVSISGLQGGPSVAWMDVAVAVKRDGVLAVAEMDPSDWIRLRESGAIPDEIEEMFDRLAHVYSGVHPDDRYIRQIMLSRRPNPDDAYWAREYGIANFTSVATAGDVDVVMYREVCTLSTLRHEFGHVVDTLGGQTQKHSSTAAWRAAMRKDAEVSGSFAPPATYGPNPDVGAGHAVVYGERGVSTYAVRSQSEQEDFAEAVRLYLIDREWGDLYRAGPRTVRFADVFPERARILDDLITPYP